MHPSQYLPTPVSTTPSRRLNTLAAKAQTQGLRVDLHRTIAEDNLHSQQYRLQVSAPFPGTATLQVLASRSKHRRPLRPWNYYLTYTKTRDGEPSIITHYMKRWDSLLVRGLYHLVEMDTFQAKVSSLSARMAQLDQT